MEVIISTWRMAASILKLILINSTWNYTTFHSFFSMLKKNIFKVGRSVIDWQSG